MFRSCLRRLCLLRPGLLLLLRLLRCRLVAGLHRREEQDVADRLRACQKHAHAVDAVADTARRRHADLERVEEVLIGVVRLLVARGKCLFLRLEALSLIDRVIELGVRVAHFPAVHVHLEAENLARMLRILLRERGDLDRMTCDKCRLNQLVLDKCVEEQVQDVADLVSLLELDIVLLRHGARLIERLDLIEVDAAVLLYGLCHRHLRERLAEVDFISLVDDLRRAVDLLADRAVHVLSKLHHAVVIRVRLIELHQRELRIVLHVEAFISEDAADLVDSLKSADDQSLQVELQGNAELLVLVERIKMRDERTRGRAARVVDKHRRLDFHEIPRVEIAADAGNDLRPLDEGRLDLRVHDEVDISLAVADVRVRQAVELLRKNLQGFG